MVNLRQCLRHKPKFKQIFINICLVAEKKTCVTIQRRSTRRKNLPIIEKRFAGNRYSCITITTYVIYYLNDFIQCFIPFHLCFIRFFSIFSLFIQHDFRFLLSVDDAHGFPNKTSAHKQSHGVFNEFEKQQQQISFYNNIMPISLFH